MIVYIQWMAGFYFVVHQIASIWQWPRNKTSMNVELIRQHHESCAMLALIALSIATIAKNF